MHLTRAVWKMFTNGTYRDGMRAPLLSAALILASCNATPSNPLLENDWTNGRQPCSETNLSFKNGRIAYHPKDGQISLFDIEWMSPLPDDPQVMVVHVKPAKELQDSLATQGMAWPSTGRPTFIFRVHKNRLSLVGLRKSDAERMHVPTLAQARRFDLIACPT